MSQKVRELQPVCFDVNCASAIAFQWRSNGVDIIGATNRQYMIAAASAAMNATRYSVLVSGLTNQVLSADAVLTVLPATNKPALVSAYMTETNTLVVSFDVPVSEETATNLAHYAITNTLGGRVEILRAALINGTNVILAMGARSPGDHVLVANGICDNSSLHNAMLQNSAVTAGWQQYEVLGTNTIWRMNQQGVDLGAEWRQTNYDDNVAGWESAYGAFDVYLGQHHDNVLGIPVRTHLTRTNLLSTNAIPTYYFRAWIHLPVVNSDTVLRLNYVVDDGAAFYANGQLANSIRVTIPTAYGSYAEGSVNTLANEGPFELPLTNFVAGSNLFACELKNVNATSSDATMAAFLTLQCNSRKVAAGYSTNNPVFTSCPTNVIINLGDGCLSGYYPDLASQAVIFDDLGNRLSVTQYPPAGTLLQLGINPVSFTAMDALGRVATATGSVFVVANPPVVGVTNVAMKVSVTNKITIPVTNLVKLGTSPDARTIVGIGGFSQPVNGGSVVVQGTNLIYTAPAGTNVYEDYFSFTVQDCAGMFGTGWCVINFGNSVVTNQLITPIVTPSTSNLVVTVVGYGTPGNQFQLQRNESPTNSATWTNLGISTASSDTGSTNFRGLILTNFGLFFINDTNPPDQSFYRTKLK